jgi:hypothetical protein
MPDHVKPKKLSDRRLRRGRLAVYLEPRDIWIGVYRGPDAVYVLPLPFVVFKWTHTAGRQPATTEGGRNAQRRAIAKAYRTAASRVQFMASGRIAAYWLRSAADDFDAAADETQADDDA